jgi:hypothetical protein
MTPKILTPDRVNFTSFSIQDYDTGRIIELQGRVTYKDSDEVETHAKIRSYITLDEASDADKAIINAMITLSESKIKAEVNLE